MGGGGYSRSRLSAHLVHAAAGAHTTADEYEDDNNDTSYDGGNGCSAVSFLKTEAGTKFLFFFIQAIEGIRAAVSVVAIATAELVATDLGGMVFEVDVIVGFTVLVSRHNGNQGHA